MSIAQQGTEDTPRQRTRLDPEARRGQIVREATRLIAESGFNGVSLADIADACGIRKPSVLYYFPSMNHLLEAVLLDRDARSYDPRTQDLLSVSDPALTREAVTDVFRRNLETRELIRLYAILGAEALSPEHPAHGYFAARDRGARTEMERILAWKPDPAAAAVELLAFWGGLELEWLRDPDLDAVRIWDAFCDRFFA